MDKKFKAASCQVNIYDVFKNLLRIILMYTRDKAFICPPYTISRYLAK